MIGETTDLIWRSATHESKDKSADFKTSWKKYPDCLVLVLYLVSGMFNMYWFLHQNVIKINYTYLTNIRKAKEVIEINSVNHYKYLCTHKCTLSKHTETHKLVRFKKMLWKNDAY